MGGEDGLASGLQHRKLANVKTQHFNEYTGEPLPSDFVWAVMMEEMTYFSDKSNGTAADNADMQAMKDSAFVRLRWSTCNKRNLEKPGVRTRLVACEVAKDKQSALYASTPPLESKKALFSEYAAEGILDGKPLALSLIEIKKAYFSGVPQKNVFMSPLVNIAIPMNDQCATPAWSPFVIAIIVERLSAFMPLIMTFSAKVVACAFIPMFG